MCESVRANIKNNLIEYYQILELQPELIDQLQNSKITLFDE